MTDEYERIGLNFEVAVYRLGCRLYPEKPRLLGALALALGATGRVSEALRVMDQLLRREPDKPCHHYNRACLLCRLGRHEDAMDALADALDHGFDDFQYMSADPDLRPLRARPQFREYRRRAMEQCARRVNREA
jgi:tetratricopeptide (TPR) repeat protein